MPNLDTALPGARHPASRHDRLATWLSALDKVRRTHRLRPSPMPDLLQYFERLFCARCRFPVDTEAKTALAEFLEPRVQAFERDQELWQELHPSMNRWLVQVADQASLLCEIRDDEAIRPEFLQAARQIVSGWSAQPNTFLG